MTSTTLDAAYVEKYFQDNKNTPLVGVLHKHAQDVGMDAVEFTLSLANMLNAMLHHIDHGSIHLAPLDGFTKGG